MLSELAGPRMRAAGDPRSQRRTQRQVGLLRRRLYVVARDHPTLFEALKREFVDAAACVEVVLDRRLRKDPPPARTWSRARKAGGIFEAELRRCGWAVFVY